MTEPTPASGELRPVLARLRALLERRWGDPRSQAQRAEEARRSEAATLEHMRAGARAALAGARGPDRLELARRLLPDGAEVAGQDQLRTYERAALELWWAEQRRKGIL